ncbi:DUF1127 domain-containing protein [Sneathiella marina]|uniref:DUF1127 domain-containing protein n=1 Tax=Sneathiella marina TaxID=2950108 RepID=A0ABY4W2U3_9PROT|nr:DUF1127 domain-containing protein [Sneathiella marina]USG61515.1 DUF1127 domain-containing protein [Sneathiella marina]
MTYAYIEHTETRNISIGIVAVSVLSRIAEILFSTCKSVQQRWSYHKSVAEFSGMNDHMLRGIGVHRSEISAIVDHGADLSKARYYR